MLTLLTALLLAPLAALHAADRPIDRHSLLVYDDFGDAQAEKPAFHSSGAVRADTAAISSRRWPCKTAAAETR